jgi:hypothetical protein
LEKCFRLAQAVGEQDGRGQIKCVGS